MVKVKPPKNTLAQVAGFMEKLEQLELALTEAGLASMQAGGFDHKAFAALLGLDATVVPISLLAIGRLPEGHEVPSKTRTGLRASAGPWGPSQR